MNLTRRAATVGGLSVLAGSSLSTLSLAEFGGEFRGIGEGLEDFWLATDADIYGYALVTMEMTRRVVTNVARPEGTKAPMGQIIKLREYPTPAFKDVTAPNADTLYTTAFFDVGNEPWVLSIPDTKGRYALFPMLDGWTTVFQVPASARPARARRPTPLPARAGKARFRRAYTSTNRRQTWFGCSAASIAPGHQKTTTPSTNCRTNANWCHSSAYGKSYTPPEGNVDPSIDMKTAVRDQVNRMDAQAYFTLLAQLMKTNPPAAADAPEIARFARIGLVPGKDFDASKLNADFVKRIPEVGFDRIMLQFKVNKEVKDINGWGFTTKTGIYGTDYLMRALVTAIGLGANRPQDAVYPTSLKDADRKAYDGANRYVMRFPKGQLPPARGFCSRRPCTMTSTSL